MTHQDFRYLVVGSGKVARHWAAYLDMLGLPCLRWSRAAHENEALTASLNAVELIFLAIADDSLELFHDAHLRNFSGPIYHFSGCHLSRNMYTCHPLMTFGETLYEPETYRRIPLVLESADTDGVRRFSRFPNPVISIASDCKPLYHALCVMSCNFPQIIWANTVRQFEELGIGADLLYPLLLATLENSLNPPGGCITGPLARNDRLTMEKNIQSLHGDHEKELYRSFVKLIGL